jgi:hypothetical protein
MRVDGKPVQHALVVLVVLDPRAKNRLHPYRAVQYWTVKQARETHSGIEPASQEWDTRGILLDVPGEVWQLF